MRKEVFVTGGFYHLYNRGVDKRETFMDDADRRRFLDSMANALDDDGSRSVTIVAYALMPNHFHFLVQQTADGGVSAFMHRLGTAYTIYFNKRYERSGVLFQGAFKAVPVTTDGQLLHVTRYIHRNPIDLYKGDDENERWAWLKRYRWSNLAEYLGLRFSSVTNGETILEHFSGPRDYLSYVKDWDRNICGGGLAASA